VRDLTHVMCNLLAPGAEDNVLGQHIAPLVFMYESLLYAFIRSRNIWRTMTWSSLAMGQLYMVEW
jgi:hypothetical protein